MKPPSVPIENRAGLTDPEFGPLAAELAGHATMTRALPWFSTQTPPIAPDGMVTQDEFSFDILVPFREGLYLAYDSN
ncbi:hypothetical protein [Tautonia rosea]|uniref:hypothetical protein n=1 Tax=Tautonia rosea TaxID=2728037 RepID=UPI001472E49B|nr:hypothetical protein [Tautonia rosea]